jgi:hypothetical protein
MPLELWDLRQTGNGFQGAAQLPLQALRLATSNLRFTERFK